MRWRRGGWPKKTGSSKPANITLRHRFAARERNFRYAAFATIRQKTTTSALNAGKPSAIQWRQSFTCAT